MKTQFNTMTRCLAAAAMLSLGALANPAHALTVDLTAEAYNATMPNGDVVIMWGYRLNGGAVQSPGAQIIVPAGDTTLTVNLTNTLPMPTSLVVHGLNQNAAGVGMVPVYTDITLADTNTTATTCAIGSSRFCRLRSMTNEAPAAVATTNGTASYTYTNVKPGTYMYQSGTLPQIQVQMGLYGMVTQNAVDGNAAATPAVLTQPYPGLAADKEVKLVFSEVDPLVHQNVAAGTFTGSTLDYQPKYFRIHSYDATGATATQLSSTDANQVLGVNYIANNFVRMVNAGLQTRVPTLSNGTWFVIAEDGNPYPFAREQYTAFMPAAKTMDVLFTRAVPATGDTTATLLSVFDRRMAHNTTGTSVAGDLNGQFVQFNMSGSAAVQPPLPPTINVASCLTTGTQGVAYACTAVGNSATLAYSLVTAPAGMSINAGTGAITWTPTNDQAQRPASPAVTNPVTARVTVTSGANAGATADGTFTVVVANVNDAPTAVAKTYRLVSPFAAPTNPPLSVAAATGLLVGANDVDGDVLTAVMGTQPALAANGTVAVNATGAFTLSGYTAPAVAPATTPTSTDRVFTFTYTAQDAVSALTPAPALNSAPATVTVTLHRNIRPTAANIGGLLGQVVPALPLGTPAVINLAAATSDADGTIVPSSLSTAQVLRIPLAGNTLPAAQPAGAFAVSSAGVVTFTPAAGFRGIVTYSYTVLDNDGAISNTSAIVLRVQ
jgi:Bacterial Ig domain